MSATYTNIILMKMTALGISQQQLGYYAGIRSQQLSPLLSGQKSLDAVSLTKINDALASLEKLAEAALPWVLDFRRVVEIKKLMDQLKYGELDKLIAATREAAAELAPAELAPDQG